MAEKIKVRPEVIQSFGKMGMKEALRKHAAGEGDAEFNEGIRRYYSQRRIDEAKKEYEASGAASKPEASRPNSIGKAAVTGAKNAVQKGLEASVKPKPRAEVGPSQLISKTSPAKGSIARRLKDVAAKVDAPKKKEERKGGRMSEAEHKRLKEAGEKSQRDTAGMSYEEKKKYYQNKK